MILRLYRAIALRYLNHQMRANADECNWLASNVEYGRWRIAQCEERHRRLQAEAWALECPAALARKGARA